MGLVAAFPDTVSLERLCRSNFTFVDDGQPTAHRRDGTVLFFGLECSVTLSGFSCDGLGQIVKSYFAVVVGRLCQ